MKKPSDRVKEIFERDNPSSCAGFSDTESAILTYLDEQWEAEQNNIPVFKGRLTEDGNIAV